MTTQSLSGADHYDVVIVGSGFGGSVAALRLTEKGYRVAVLEAGRRFTEATYPKTSWDLRNYLWAPKLGCYGLQRIHLLPDVLIMAGAGVGGGSLNYANTLYQPPEPFFRDPQWGGMTDWLSELSPYYDQARRMLGVNTNPFTTAADEAMLDVAKAMGAEDTFTHTPVGVFFGEPGVKGRVADPYFGGAGPERIACNQCGSCMTGCRVGGKNTLPQNYLYLAESAGATVVPLTTVTSIRDLGGPANGGYAVDTVKTGSWRTSRPQRTFTCDRVVVSAGTYGTQRLLHTLRDTGVLPRLSARLGSLTRTNSEAILGASARNHDVDYSRGVAITSSFHPSADTHIEPVRYGKGSNAIGLLQMVLVDGGGKAPRWVKALGVIAKDPKTFARSFSVHRWSERTVIALVMQTRDNSLVVQGKKGLFGRRKLTSHAGPGEAAPTWIPQGHEAARLLAERIGGDAGGSMADVANIPMTAHFLGGCAIGASAETGVLDGYQRAYGHPGITVADGSAVSANLGVNPSLTITAMSERTFALWPNRGEADPRPAPGSAYTRVAPVAPRSPVVPASAPGALLLPMPTVRVTTPA